jgi:hypothetical protein
MSFEISSKVEIIGAGPPAPLFTFELFKPIQKLSFLLKIKSVRKSTQKF